MINNEIRVTIIMVTDKAGNQAIDHVQDRHFAFHVQEDKEAVDKLEAATAVRLGLFLGQLIAAERSGFSTRA